MAELVISTSALDATLFEDQPTTVHSAGVEHLKYATGANRRVVMKFDLNGLSVNALVSAVTLQVYAPLPLPTGPVSVYRIKRAWDEGTVCWNTPWATPGCENTTSDRASGAMGSATMVNGWNTFTLGVAEFNLMRAANYGLLFVRTGEGGYADTIDVNGRDATDNKPKLTITYTIPQGGDDPEPNEIEIESYKKYSHGLRYQVEQFDSSGNRIGVYQAFNELRYVKTRNTVGSMILTMPYKLGVDAEFSVGQVLEIWREMDGALELQNESAYIVRNVRYYSDDEGRNMVEVVANDGLDLLEGAIVDYPAGSAQSEKEMFADDMIKQIGIENLGTSALAARRLPRFTVQPLASASVSLSKGFAWRNVLDVCTEIADYATESGVHTSFDVVRVDPATFELRTYIGCRGIDHGRNSGDIIRVGEVYGNLRNATYEEMYLDSYNAVTAGGSGEEANRIIVRRTDAKRIAVGSPYNRRELFVDTRNSETAAEVGSEADAALIENRPKKVMSGKLENNRGLKWGRDYRFGDILAVEAFGRNMDCHIESVSVVVDSEQNENVTIYLRGESDL